MRQDRLRDTGKASRYPLESPTLTHAAAGEKNKDHKEVGDTPGIDPPSNRGNLNLRTLASYPMVYGPLVGVVVFMVWVYLAALVLLIGAEVMIQVPTNVWRSPDGHS